MLRRKKTEVEKGSPSAESGRSASPRGSHSPPLDLPGLKSAKVRAARHAKQNEERTERESCMTIHSMCRHLQYIYIDRCNVYICTNGELVLVTDLMREVKKKVLKQREEQEARLKEIEEDRAKVELRRRQDEQAAEVHRAQAARRAAERWRREREAEERRKAEREQELREQRERQKLYRKPRDSKESSTWM